MYMLHDGVDVQSAGSDKIELLFLFFCTMGGVRLCYQTIIVITFYDICINKVVLQLCHLVVALQNISHILLCLLLVHPLQW